jgi:hypothetical protein
MQQHNRIIEKENQKMIHNIDKINQYIKKYNESKKNKYGLIRKKLLNDASTKTVLIPLAVMLLR